MYFDDLKNDFVCHNCGNRFKKGRFKFFMFSLGAITRKRSLLDSFDSFGSKNEPYHGGFWGRGKCPDCKSKDTSVFNR